MTALEARTLAKNTRNMNLDKINAEIARAAKTGDDRVRYDLTGMEAKFSKDLIEQLKNQGFRVEHINGSDQRENDSWNYFVISWD